MLRLAGRAAFGIGRLLRGMALLVLACTVLALIVLAGLAWRLAEGPLDVAWLARRIEAAAQPPDAATRLAIGQATLSWPGFREGPDRGIELALRDLRLVNRSGAPGAALREAAVTLSLGRLLIGQAVPRTVLLTGLHLRVLRAADGELALDLGSLNETAGDEAVTGAGPTLAQTITELGRPAGSDRSTAAAALDVIAQLQHVRLRDAVLGVVDARFATRAEFAIAELDLQRQPQGGVRGAASGRVRLGGAEATLAMQADLLPSGGTRVSAVLSPVAMDALSRADPGLADLGALEAAVEATATLDLSARLRPLRATLHASTGPGRLRLPGADLAFRSLELDGSAGWAGEALLPDRLVIQQAAAVVGVPGAAPTTLGLSGDAELSKGRIAGAFTATVDQLAFADLGALWPAAWGGNVRPWLVQNVVGGTARNGNVRFRLDAAGDLAEPRVLLEGGSLQGEDATIHWLRPVPPIEHAQALLTIVNADGIDIAVASARQGGIAIRDGLIHFTGLSQKDQAMSLRAEAAGGVAEVLALLRHPRLHLLDRKPITTRNPGGSMTGRLSVDMPLEKDLDFDMVRIRATAKLSDLRLGGLVANRDLERGEIAMDVSTEGMKASGPAVIAGIPAQMAVTMDFRPGPASQAVQVASATGRATPRQLAAAGLDPGGLMPGGTAGLSASYTQRRDGRAELQVQADLRDAALSLAGWRKPPGQPAAASARLPIRGDKLLGIEALQAQGPGLQVAGRFDMVGDRPLLLHLDRLVLGQTQATGEVRLPPTPAEPIRAALTGPVLDLADQLARTPSKSVERDSPWVADVTFDRVLLGKQRSLSGVTAHAEHDGLRLRVLDARSALPEQVQASIRPGGTGRQLTVHAADGGAVLRAMDLLDSIQGGAMALAAQYDDSRADPPLSGTLHLTDFQVRDAPAIGRLLQAITVYGMIDALRGPGLRFSRMILPFRLEGEVLQITDAQAYSPSLGITVRGQVDGGRKTIDLRGTVVPAYVLNSALGRIPLIGRLFSAEQGGGLVAIDYALRGSAADPSVSVNPLSALTPGFLRGLFRLFE